jgi:nucleotide-binding universal stress UspA family protein
VVEKMVRVGKNIYNEINAAADKINPLFIIIGVGRIHNKKYGGKNALQMIRKSAHPIISIGGKSHRNGCKTILMPLDLTMMSREKIPGAVEFAKLFGAQIQIVIIVKNESKLEQNKLHMFASQSVKFIRDSGVACGSKFITTKEDPVKALIDFAAKVEADLIVIASDRYRTFREYFTGTPAQRLVNFSDIPVLTLRPLDRRDTTAAQTAY